jgi:N utilization substance protein B
MVGETTRLRAYVDRSSGRALALQMVYSFEQNHYKDDGSLVPDDIVEGASEDARKFAQLLFDGFSKERVAVDNAVDRRLDNWSIQRLAVLDRSILRLGAYELLYNSATPPRVAINEYIELAKQFGSDIKTAKLVNGVLDRIAREHRPNEITRANPVLPDPAT